MRKIAIPPEATPFTLRSVMIAVATAQFMLPFMLAGVSLILPAIGVAFQASAVELSLVNAIYILALAIFHLVAGRVGDIIGRKRLFLSGTSLFLVMSMIIPLTTSVPQLLICRFFQAIGTATMNTCALAILVSCSPPGKLGQVLGLVSMGVFLGISLGPTLAGTVEQFFGWQFLFYMVVPVGIAGWLLMALPIKGDWTDSPEDPFDWRGALLYVMGICGFSIGCIWILQGWWAWLLLSIGIGCLWLFIRVERRIKSPILDIRFVVSNKPFLLSLIASFINYSSVFGLMFYFSLYLQTVHGLSPFEAGLVLSVQPVSQLICGPFGGRMSDKHGAERMATLAIGVCGLGLLVAVFLGKYSPIWQVGVVQALIGIGIGFFASSNTSAIMKSVDNAHRGQASGLTGTSRTLGMLVSMMIISLTMNIYLGDAPLGPENADAFLSAMRSDLILFSMFSFISMFVALRRNRAHVQ